MTNEKRANDLRQVFPLKYPYPLKDYNFWCCWKETGDYSYLLMVLDGFKAANIELTPIVINELAKIGQGYVEGTLPRRNSADLGKLSQKRALESRIFIEMFNVLHHGESLGVTLHFASKVAAYYYNIEAAKHGIKERTAGSFEQDYSRDFVRTGQEALWIEEFKAAEIDDARFPSSAINYAKIWHDVIEQAKSIKFPEKLGDGRSFLGNPRGNP